MNSLAISGLRYGAAFALLACRAAGAGLPQPPADPSTTHPTEATAPLVTSAAVHAAAVAAARESLPITEPGRPDAPTGPKATAWRPVDRAATATGVAAIALRLACEFSRNCSLAEVANASPAAVLRPVAAIPHSPD